MKKLLAVFLALVLCLTACCALAESDAEYVKAKGTLVVGITDFEPMDYRDADGNWIGYDADMAALFAESLGVTVVFQEIEWDNKILELNGQMIDCVWNGMTLTDEVLSSMSCSTAYMENAQVIVMKADKLAAYTDVSEMSALSFAVESGSAGASCAAELELAANEVTSQSAALMEVAAGTSDAAIIDLLMAQAMTGEGTGYADLAYGFKLNSEEYGVGFRSGSDLAELANTFFAEKEADGTNHTLLVKYGLLAE